MSRIDDLIAQFCPEGVEYHGLGDVGEFIRGNGLQKSDLTVSGVGAIHYGQIHTIYGVWTDETKSFVTEEKARRLRKARPGDLVIATTSEDDAAVAKAVAWVGENEIAVSGDAYIYRHSLEPKYVAYFFQTEQFQSKKTRYITGTKLRRISGGSLAKIMIPVPPLEVQREIVKVLDKFTKLEADLETKLAVELEARRRQYQYYRDALFVFKNRNVRWATMSEVGEFFRGRRFTKDDYVPDGTRCIHYGDIYTQYGTATTATVSHVRSDMASALRFAKPGDLVIAGVGETVEDVGKAVAWLGDGEVAIHDDCFAFRHSLNPKFVSYYFQTAAFHGEKNKFVARGKLKRLSSENLGKLTIPVPQLDEQERIVAILDKFEALVNYLSNGLPAEIKARRQQYEHHRNRLLSFREAA